MLFNPSSIFLLDPNHIPNMPDGIRLEMGQDTYPFGTTQITALLTNEIVSAFDHMLLVYHIAGALHKWEDRAWWLVQPDNAIISTMPLDISTVSFGSTGINITYDFSRYLTNYLKPGLYRFIYGFVSLEIPTIREGRVTGYSTWDGYIYADFIIAGQ